MPITNLPPCGCGEWLVKHTSLRHRTVTRRGFTSQLLGSSLFEIFPLPKKSSFVKRWSFEFVAIWAFCYEAFLFSMYEYMLI